MFYQIGLDSIPKPAQYAIASSFFVVPILLLMYIICFMKDDIYDPEEYKGVPLANPPKKVEEKKSASTAASNKKDN